MLGGIASPGARAIAIESTSVLTGEQSNTSIICSVAEGGPVILKIFRALHAGDNPDVVLQSAISAAGSDLVPASIGYLSGEWPDSAEDGGIARGHIAFVQDFQIGAEDGWRLALRAAEDREDFTRRASLLGRATAELHETLAAVLPTSEAGPDDIERFVNAMARRAESALAEVPDLEPMRAQIEAAINASRDAAWPPLQRIHGDYHLGQVLWVADPDEPGSGRWLIIDFEGEPLRPMRERSASDIALRDVAGMLRSFDYVPGAVAHRALPSVGSDEREGANSDLESWARAARNAFLSGYSDRAGFDLTEFHALQGAFELDKALYEAVYEAGNRPDWLRIPVAAITRLISN